MSSSVRRVRGDHQKELVKMFDSLFGRHSRWDIWTDFIVFSATAIANAVDKSNKNHREAEYMSRASKYNSAEMQVFSKMLAEIVLAMDENPNQDFLGELFMALNLSNEWKGQFFTPYDVCVMMARITGNIKDYAESNGWASVSDPACGAGALLIAFANECRRVGINYQTKVLFVAQDIDYIAGLMCYIQLSLLGCAGYVVIANTLTNPVVCYDKRGLIPVHGENVWYTPLYFRDVWHMRRIWARMDMMLCAADTKAVKRTGIQAQSKNILPNTNKPVKRVKPKVLKPAIEISETKTGQLMFF